MIPPPFASTVPEKRMSASLSVSGSIGRKRRKAFAVFTALTYISMKESSRPPSSTYIFGRYSYSESAMEPSVNELSGVKNPFCTST